MPWPRCVSLRLRAAPRRRRADSHALNTTSGGNRPSADRCDAGELAVGEREAAVARKLFIERSVAGVVNDVVSPRFEFRGDARQRRGVAGDFGEPHRLAAPEEVRDAFALALGARADRRWDSR